MPCHHFQKSNKIAIIVFSVFGPLLKLNLFIAHRGWVVCPQVDAPVALLHSDTISNFKNHKEKAVLFDYDGTLAPFVEDPNTATPSEALSEALVELNKDPTAHVAIISGRAQNFLDQHFTKYQNFHLSAEYGASQRKPGEKWVDAPGLELGWKPYVMNLMKTECKKHPGPVNELVEIEEKVTGVVLHYRKLNNRARQSDDLAESLKLVEGRITILDPFYQKLLKLNRAGKLGSNKLKVENENLAIEVRLGALLSKGKVVEQLLESNPRITMAISAGDSSADEDMIKTLKLSGPSVIETFHVKNDKFLATKAMHSVEEPQQIVDLVRAFYDMKPKKIEANEAI